MGKQNKQRTAKPPQKEEALYPSAWEIPPVIWEPLDITRGPGEISWEPLGLDWGGPVMEWTFNTVSNG